MLTDPITVAANSPNPALAFSVIRSDGYGAERRDAAGLYGLVINHSTNKSGDRHYVKVTKTINAQNPYSGLTSPQSASVSIAISKPSFGFTDAELGNLVTVLLDTLASADAGVSNIIAFQS